jgi:cytochrome c-type biogenesis protein CcmH/NrfF/Tfp pilus assembly protein PilF
MTRKRIVWMVIGAVAIIAAVVGSIPESEPMTQEQRVESIAGDIMCPTCQGLSVAESNSPLAQSSQDEIERLVSEGQSDEQIKDYFVSRYGESALMSPDREGSTLLIWLIPAAFAVGAAAFITGAVRRWKRNPDRADETIEDPFAKDGEDEQDDAPTMSTFALNRRSSTAMFAVMILLIAGAFAVATSSERQDGDETTGSVDRGPTELLVQAQQLTAEGEAAEALRTYDEVLEMEPDNEVALAYRGWLLRLAGLPDEGLESIDAAIAADETYPDARFFRGFILLQDQNRPADAVEEFEEFLALDPPEQMRPLVEDALADARAQANRDL